MIKHTKNSGIKEKTLNSVLKKNHNKTSKLHQSGFSYPAKVYFKSVGKIRISLIKKI